MKLIVKKDFANVKALGLKLDPKTPGFKHENIVHKGARINIGAADFYKDLSGTEQEIVGTLLKHGCVVFDDKENNLNGVIDTIDKEVKAEAAAAAKAEEIAAASKPVTLAEVLQLLANKLNTPEPKK